MNLLTRTTLRAVTAATAYTILTAASPAAHADGGPVFVVAPNAQICGSAIPFAQGAKLPEACINGINTAPGYKATNGINLDQLLPAIKDSLPVKPAPAAPIPR